MSFNQLKRLPPSHYSLLEASRERKTTNTKVLAQYLDRTPATVRTQFQRIMAFLEVHCRYEALRKAEEQGLIRKVKRPALVVEEVEVPYKNTTKIDVGCEQEYKAYQLL